MHSAFGISDTDTAPIPQMWAVSGSVVGRPASSAVRIMSSVTGARRKIFVAERIADRVQDGAGAGADRRFADAARADRRFRIRQIDGRPLPSSAARRESSAAGCGGIAWPARRRSAGRTPTSGRSHDRCPASSGRESDRRDCAGESPCRHRPPPDNPGCGTCRFRRRFRPRQTPRRTNATGRRAGSCPWRHPSDPGRRARSRTSVVNWLMSFGSS